MKKHKMTEKPDAGVYAIFCLLTGLAYIGASKHLLARLKQHFDLLRLNRHPCGQLQKDWNECGSECFTHFPLEAVPDAAALSKRERAWTRKCLIEGQVYNRLNAVTKEHKKAFEQQQAVQVQDATAPSAKFYIFVSPTGEVFKVRGLNNICAAYNLNVSHMSKVARGRYVHHKGWIAKDIAD